ncbi:hypothetical protein [Streptomyces sp. NBC_01508]|uniref:hypothetical protein n=1 Tax=Streptomyces sp. NBC_01508 TaxID=2903888 RepID=UPI0038673A8B
MTDSIPPPWVDDLFPFPIPPALRTLVDGAWQHAYAFYLENDTYDHTLLETHYGFMFDLTRTPRPLDGWEGYPEFSDDFRRPSIPMYATPEFVSFGALGDGGDVGWLVPARRQPFRSAGDQTVDLRGGQVGPAFAQRGDQLGGRFAYRREFASGAIGGSWNSGTAVGAWNDHGQGASVPTRFSYARRDLRWAGRDRRDALVGRDSLVDQVRRSGPAPSVRRTGPCRHTLLRHPARRRATMPLASAWP